MDFANKYDSAFLRLVHYGRDPRIKYEGIVAFGFAISSAELSTYFMAPHALGVEVNDQPRFPVEARLKTLGLLAERVGMEETRAMLSGSATEKQKAARRLRICLSPAVVHISTISSTTSKYDDNGFDNRNGVGFIGEYMFAYCEENNWPINVNRYFDGKPSVHHRRMIEEAEARSERVPFVHHNRFH